MKTPDISVIIPNFNTLDLTRNAILSVAAENELDIEIIVVENGSSDGSYQMLKKLKTKVKNLKIIRNKKNIGFGGANNQGMKLSRGRYILLLNSDTLVNPHTLPKMLSFMEERENVGIASCLLNNADGSAQGTGGAFPTLLRVFAWMFFLEDIPYLDRLFKPFHPVHGRSPFYKGSFGGRLPEKRDWITGAFMMIKKKTIEATGYFDTDFFMYTEEVDYCYRASKLGFETWLVPEVSIIHFGGASGTTLSTITSEFAGIKTFYRKHLPKWQSSILNIIIKLGVLIRIPLFLLVGQPQLSKSYATAIKNI